MLAIGFSANSMVLISKLAEHHTSGVYMKFADDIVALLDNVSWLPAPSASMPVHLGAVAPSHCTQAR